MPKQVLQLRWPTRGVVRRGSTLSGDESCPWALNVRAEAFDRRLRGGSRTGLTKFVASDFGTIIADMVSINVSRAAGGASEILFVLADSTVKTVENDTVSSPVAYLTNGSGDILTDESGNRVVASFGTGASAPASGFLITGQQMVFAVTGSAVVRMDPKTGLVDSFSATSGTIPSSCTFGAVYRDRLCLSGQDNTIHMSRQGDYSDWYYGTHAGDQQRAVPFQLSLSADVGARPTAMIPCMDSYLICATARSLWVVQGDPTTGNLRRVSETVGIVGSRAWCRVDGTIVFLAEDGLYVMGADGSGLKPLTPESLPDELRDIDPSTTNVSIGYDSSRPAFHIYLRTSGGNDTHWLYEVEQQAFWPIKLANDHAPRTVCRHGGELLLAGSDGYIRKVTGDDDDGEPIRSHVALGPFPLSESSLLGRLQNIHASLASGSGTVKWHVVTGNTAEEAADNAKAAIEAGGDGEGYSKASGVWVGGRSTVSYPRVRGVFACLWLESAAKWAFESVIAETMPSGSWKGI